VVVETRLEILVEDEKSKKKENTVNNRIKTNEGRRSRLMK